MSWRPVELNEIVQRAMETVRPVIDQHEHHLSLTLAARPLCLHADPTRLEQVFLNLTANAAKYTDAGGDIHVTVERREHTAVVTVADTGIGVAADMLEKIFDLFTQVPRTQKLASGGLGIGLTLVKKLVEMHGGCVEVHSDGLGRGSEFQVHLPIVAEPT